MGEQTQAENAERPLDDNAYHVLTMILSPKVIEVLANESKRTEAKINPMGNGAVKLGNGSRIIFLNKTCFNGLYRVNKAGQFNTPFGVCHNPDFVCETAIRDDHAYFSKNKIRMLSKDFEQVVRGAKQGNIVYFGPRMIPFLPMPPSRITILAGSGIRIRKV